jgi:hypothetical protein
VNKFTEGPWAMCHRGESLKGAAGQDVVIWGCGLTNGTRTDEADANSALIASAPEMYKLLEFIASAPLAAPHKAVEIKKLLSKARGES